MTETQIKNYINKLDTTSLGVQEKVWPKLRPLGEKLLPFFLDAIPNMKKYQGRAWIVYHSIRYARNNDNAFEIGILALKDKSSIVRYRGCMLMAYSLKKKAIPILKNLLSHSDPKTSEDAIAAIDAIKSKNSNYFIDRKHTNKIFLDIS